ncbi:MAG: Ig-like domain-containing protein, partial [Bacteroidales bacterium]|nr:Ig-like domain-containing protein [Bacteroidales bacterium]
ATEPYLICEAAQLDSVRNHLNKHFRLANDIDLTDYITENYSGVGWLPIGNSINRFTGSFHGGGYTISGLTINRSTNYIGLFGYLSGAGIDSLGIENCAVTGNMGVGGLAGYNSNNSTITNCYVTGNVTGDDVSVGGLAGINNNAAIENCYATANVTGYNDVGGLLGSNVNNVALSNCYASGKVTGYAIVGGLVGYNENAAIENCVAANDTIIATNSSTSINRIIGSNYASTLTNNYANEDMIVESGGSPFNITADKGTSGKAGADQTMATLKTLSFYNATALWDIDGTENSAVIWRICENTSLPFFQWQEDIVCPTPPDAIFCGGDGTLGNPYLICNPEQLDSIRYFLDDHFKLADDINLTTYLASGAGFDKWDVDGWLPIGDDSNPFTGSFHGGGHTISGLTINRGGYGNNNIGLFGYLDGAEIDSLGIVDCDITGNMYVGGLTGRNDYNAVISNCYVTGNVTGDIVGGLAGENNNAATIENCYATTNVTGNVTGNFVGGLVGANRNATISNCYAAGNVTGYDAVGGLAGTNAYATIENCVAANASVTATNFMFPSINRITSYNSGTFTNNYAFDGMIVKAGGSPVSITPNANGIEGADVDMATLKTALFYDTQGWDIDNVINPLKIWRICEGDSLPFFQWEKNMNCSCNYTLTVSADPTTGGSAAITLPDAGGTYDCGASVTVAATAEDCYAFVNWTDGSGAAVSTDNPFTFTIDKDTVLVANFEIQEYSVTVSADPTTGGSAAITLPDAGGTYDCGTSVTVAATAEDCYTFVNWTDDNGTAVSTDNPFTFTIDKDTVLIANFERQEYSVTVSADPTTGGSAAITLPDAGGSYDCGTSVTVAATAEDCYTFVNWTDGSGAAVSTDNPFTFVIDKDTVLIANFEIISYNVTVSADPTTGGSAAITLPDAGGTYDCGASVTVAATAEDCYTFVNWTDDSGAAVSTDNPFTFTIDKDTVLVANFEIISCNVTVSADPTTGGSTAITLPDAGGTYDCGTSVTVAATTEDCYAFVNWTDGNGTAVSTDNPFTFTIDKDTVLIANFEKIPYSVTVSADPPTGGAVSGGGTYDCGTSVTVAATPNTGFAFVNWTKAGTEVSTNATYNFTATENIDLVANFIDLTAVTGIEIDGCPENGWLHLNKTLQLQAIITPADATNQDVIWHSSNTNVAIVDQTGFVTAMMVGATNITVTTLDGGFVAECYIKVIQPVISITLNKNATTLAVGAEEILKATVLPENASVKTVSWESSNTAIATVDATGKVTAGAIGTATITATTDEGGFTATCDVTVIAFYPNPTGITVTPKTLTLAKDATASLSTEIKPAGANPTVTWTTGNANIATVDADGTVTGIAAGKVVITAKTVNGYSATCAVTVTANKAGEAPPSPPEGGDVWVYPNPTSGLLTICDMRYATSDNPTSDIGQSEIEIFDVMGRAVHVETRHATSLQSEIGNRTIGNRTSQITFDLSNIPTGVYFIRITTENGVVVRKVVKE